MSAFDLFKRVSKAPTNPHVSPARRTFDIADLYRGPVVIADDAVKGQELDEKLRQAYFWIVNTAIISPHYDIEYNEQPPQEFAIDDHKSADDDGGSARQSAARRSHQCAEGRRHSHRLAKMAVDAREDRGRIQPYSDSHADRAAHRDGR